MWLLEESQRPVEDDQKEGDCLGRTPPIVSLLRPPRPTSRPSSRAKLPASKPSALCMTPSINALSHLIGYLIRGARQRAAGRAKGGLRPRAAPQVPSSPSFRFASRPRAKPTSLVWFPHQIKCAWPCSDLRPSIGWDSPGSP